VWRWTSTQTTTGKPQIRGRPPTHTKLRMLLWLARIPACCCLFAHSAVLGAVEAVLALRPGGPIVV